MKLDTGMVLWYMNQHNDNILQLQNTLCNTMQQKQHVITMTHDANTLWFQSTLCNTMQQIHVITMTHDAKTR